uniref:Uncharacterized protein n=1 Tax=Desertifilum tharense IPPAS B-1220 TaxID=1781255 RepID=A0ACD5GUR8_9CYAN
MLTINSALLPHSAHRYAEANTHTQAKHSFPPPFSPLSTLLRRS